MTTELESIAIQHEYVVGGDFTSRMARAFAAYVLGRPVSIVAAIFLSTIGLALLVLAVWTGDGVFAAIGAGYLLFMPVYALVVYLRTRRGNALRLPVGSRIAVGLSPAGMRTEGPLGSGVASYRAYQSVQLRAGFVILRHRGIRVFSIFPAELFADGDLETLRSGIETANG